MEFWYVIIFISFVAICGTITILRFLGQPTEKQMEQIKAWLLWAVTQAEKELGSGTGRIKLSMVYDKFIEKFMWIAKCLPFPRFSELVDLALNEMREMLKNNKYVASIVLSDTPDTEKADTGDTQL